MAGSLFYEIMQKLSCLSNRPKVTEQRERQENKAARPNSKLLGHSKGQAILH